MYATKQKKSSEEGNKKKGEVIHSGHFMISSVSEDQDDHESLVQDRDSPLHHEHMKMIQNSYDIAQSSSDVSSKESYKVGKTPVTIDASLSRLFQCMSLAYRGGKVVSPKWKNFKGLKLTVKDKIRLNNAIWRTWHIQYVMRSTGKAPKCNQSLIQFATPMENEADFENHARPEAVVMEGKYWKRRIETVVAEYKKWRAFFMQKLRMSDFPGLTWVTDVGQNSPNKEQEFDPMNPDFYSTMFSDLSDTLFSTFTQGQVQFPNPREIAMRATNSDMIQPGLLQLQPPVDDIGMYEFQDLLNNPRKPDPQPRQNELIQMPRMNSSSSVVDDANQHMYPNHPGNSNQYQMQVQDSTSMYSSQAGCSSTTDPVFSSVQFAPANQTMFNPISTAPISAKPINQVQTTSHIHHPQQQHPHQTGGMQMMSNKPFQNTQFAANIHPNNPSQVVLTKQESDQRNNNLPVMPTPDAYSNQMFAVPPPSKRNSINTFQQPAPIVASSEPLPYFPAAPGPRNQVLQQPQQQPQYSNPQTLVMTNSNQQVVGSMPTGSDPRGVPMVTASNLSSSLQSAYNNAMQGPQQMVTDAGNGNVKLINFNLKELLMKKSSDGSQTVMLPVDGSGGIQLQNINTNDVVKIAASAPRSQTKNSGFVSDHSPGSSSTSGSDRNRRKRPTPNKSWDSISSDSGIATGSEMGENHLSKEDLSTNNQGVSENNHYAVATGPKDSKLLKIQRSNSFSAEQKRRFNIKLGFDRLQQLIPGIISESNNMKISKASVMSKATFYIKTLQNDRNQMAEELKNLRQEVDCLKSAISNTQQLLPVTGVPPVVQHGLDHAKVYFTRWVNERTRQNWKFYLFGTVIQTWFESYHQTVSLSGMNEFTHSICTWAEEKCSLPQLRSDVVHALRIICTNTNILQEPSLLPNQIQDIITQSEHDANTGGGAPGVSGGNTIMKMSPRVDYSINKVGGVIR